MTIPEACRLVLEAAFMGKGNEIFVFDMGTPVKIADLARRMIELAGLVPEQDIEIKYTGLRPGEKLYEELFSNERKYITYGKRKDLPCPSPGIRLRRHLYGHESSDRPCHQSR